MENQTPQLATAESPQVTDLQPQAPVKSSKFPVIPFLLVILVLLLASTGFLYYQNINLQKQISSLKNTTPTTTPDPTANWKTYTNDKLGFSFKYPGELVDVYDLLDEYTGEAQSSGTLTIKKFHG
jgi:hypothetical protein